MSSQQDTVQTSSKYQDVVQKYHYNFLWIGGFQLYFIFYAWWVQNCIHTNYPGTHIYTLLLQVQFKILFKAYDWFLDGFIVAIHWDYNYAAQKARIQRVKIPTNQVSWKCETYDKVILLLVPLHSVYGYSDVVFKAWSFSILFSKFHLPYLIYNVQKHFVKWYISSWNSHNSTPELSSSQVEKIGEVDHRGFSLLSFLFAILPLKLIPAFPPSFHFSLSSAHFSSLQFSDDIMVLLFAWHKYLANSMRVLFIVSQDIFSAFISSIL